MNTCDDEVIHIPPNTCKILKQEYSNLQGKSYRVIFPLKLTSILNSAFSSTAIKVLNLPPKLEYIGTDAFSSNNLLVDLVIPNSVTKIGRSAFSDNGQLLSVRFSSESKLKTIGCKAFSNCHLLKNIVLPPNLIKIDVNAFSKANSLQSVVVYTNTLQYSALSLSFTLHRCQNLQEVVIRKSKLCSSKSIYQQNIYHIYEVNTLFYACKNVRKLVLPADFKYLRYRLPSCRDVVWVISQDGFGCEYKDLLRKRLVKLPDEKNTIVCEYQLENLEYLLMVTMDIDVYNWDYLSMKVYEYLEEEE